MPDAELRPACTTEPGKDGEAEVVLPPGCGDRSTQEYFVAANVVGTTARATIERAVRLKQIRLDPGQAVCSREAADHRVGVQDFCRNASHFYFGDLDIIQARRQVLAELGVACDLAPAERPLSYEPYALLVTSDDATFRARFIAMVYEMFSDGSAAGIFDAYFPGYGKSNALGLLFRINSIPGLRPAPTDPDVQGPRLSSVGPPEPIAAR